MFWCVAKTKVNIICSLYEYEEEVKMKRLVFVSMCVCLMCSMPSYGVVVYEENFNSYTPGDPFGFGSWNWLDNGVGTHTATYEDYGSIVVKHVGAFNNTTGSAVNSRFGSKWTITMNGLNTSSDPAMYTISFDIRNLSGPWDPEKLELFVLTGTGNGVGKGSGIMDFERVEAVSSDKPAADNWIHVEWNLADLTVGWWNGSAWDLTDPTWQLEVGGPGWPGLAIQPGESFTQIWLMDNLEITMVPEPATISLLGLGALALIRRRK